MIPDPTQQNRAAYDEIAPRFAERNAEMLPYVIEAAQRLLDVEEGIQKEWFW